MNAITDQVIRDRDRAASFTALCRYRAASISQARSGNRDLDGDQRAENRYSPRSSSVTRSPVRYTKSVVWFTGFGRIKSRSLGLASSERTPARARGAADPPWRIDDRPSSSSANTSKFAHAVRSEGACLCAMASRSTRGTCTRWSPWTIEIEVTRNRQCAHKYCRCDRGNTSPAQHESNDERSRSAIPP